MHIHNNSVLHYLYDMAVDLVIYSKARAFNAKAKTKAKSSRARPMPRPENRKAKDQTSLQTSQTSDWLCNSWPNVFTRCWQVSTHHPSTSWCASLAASAPADPLQGGSNCFPLCPRRHRPSLLQQGVLTLLEILEIYRTGIIFPPGNLLEINKVSWKFSGWLKILVLHSVPVKHLAVNQD